MFLRFRILSRRHGRILEGVLKRLLRTNIGEKSSPVSTTSVVYQTTFRCLGFLFRQQDSVDPNKFAEKRQQCLHIGNLQSFEPSNTIRLSSCPRPYTHRKRKTFYITACLQKNPASQENYPSELHLVMTRRYSKVGRTFSDQMVTHVRVHFIFYLSSV